MAAEVQIVDNIFARLMQPSDFDAVDRIAETVSFHIGVHNWEILWKVSPNTFRVFVDKSKSKIIGFHTDNEVNSTYLWGHQLVLIKEYHSLGIFQKLVQQLEKERAGRGTEGHNRNHITLLRPGFNSISIKWLGYATAVIVCFI